MIDKKYQRLDEESEEDYKIRICSYRVPDRIRWDEIARILNEELGYNYSESKYRKEYSLYLRGKEDANEEKRIEHSEEQNKDNYSFSLEDIELRKRYQTSTENIPYYRLMRQDSRFERFYKMVANEIKRLPPPDFLDIEEDQTNSEEHDYLMTLADLHIGACFSSVNNVYSMEIAKLRFEKLLGKTINFIQERSIETLKILSLGDIVQGILRISDLKLNEAPVVDALVYAMRLVANFLNNLSKYCFIEFMQVMYSNHDQLRPLGTKASELSAEDMGKIFFAYLQDTLGDNHRITFFGDEEHDYFEFNIFDFSCIAMHGHQVKDVKTVYKDLANRHHKFYDYIFLGHTHSTKEIINAEAKTHDCITNVAGSFVGSCPYADSLFVGSKSSVKIYEFDRYEGQVASYKLILN